MTETEFLNDIKGVTNTRKHKVTGSLGVYDAYKWYRKNKPKDKKFILTESQYFAIIRRLNECLRQNLLDSKELVLPCRLGILEVRKYEPTITLDGKKVKTNLPIDWNTTLKLWYEDEEAFKARTLVRQVETELFKIFYNKETANYENKSFYQFSANRELKLLLKKKIKTSRFDAFTFKK